MTTDDDNLRHWRIIGGRGDDAEIVAFIDKINAEDDEREARLSAPDALTNAAAWYAQQGVLVFPLRARDKSPLFPSAHPEGSRERAECRGECGRDGHGLYDATTDVDRVRAWWKATPRANIGVRTGQLFDVIDIDGPEGFASLADYREQEQLPDIFGVAWTPRGGRHFCVKPTGEGNTTNILPGLDYRGAGGYVAVPPSIGAGGKRYDWLTPLDLDALRADR